MNARIADDTSIETLRTSVRETPGETFEDRKRLEKNARAPKYADGRRNRKQKFMLQMNFDIEPEQKDEFVRYCQGQDIKIAEACREAIAEWMDKRRGS